VLLASRLPAARPSSAGRARRRRLSMSALIDGLMSTKIDGFPVSCCRSL
jgi:hypothetical protein